MFSVPIQLQKEFYVSLKNIMNNSNFVRILNVIDYGKQELIEELINREDDRIRGAIMYSKALLSILGDRAKIDSTVAAYDRSERDAETKGEF